MRALLLSTDDRPVDALRAGGFDVVRCHESSAECVALDAGGACPLDATFVDVAVATSPHDVGIRCARRSRVPVVMATDTNGDLVAACDEAIVEQLEPVRTAVADEVEAVLDRHDHGFDPVTVEVARHDGRLYLSVATDVPKALAAVVATRAAVVARRFDDRASHLEIEVVANRT